MTDPVPDPHTDKVPMRYLLDEGESLCSDSACRRDHAAEVEFATNHMGDPPNPYVVLGLEVAR